MFKFNPSSKKSNQPKAVRDARATMERTLKRYGDPNQKVSREPLSEEGKKWLK